MYSMGKRSRERLAGVHPHLVQVTTRAISITIQDFSVLQGLRSLAQQKEYVRTGASQTMNSRHLIGQDNFGHAVDLGAWLSGEVRWEWPLYLPIADAMRKAAIELGIPVRWGGGWFLLNDYTSARGIKAATEAYVTARRKAGRKAFLDGPHFELPAGRAYP